MYHLAKLLYRMVQCGWHTTKTNGIYMPIPAETVCEQRLKPTPGSPNQLPTWFFPYIPNCHLSLTSNLAAKGRDFT